MTTQVLIIDDDADTRDALREFLASWDYDLEVAADGGEGITLALERRPEVVLCDIGLPDLDGYEVARRIRSVAPELRLVALTGSDEDENAAAGIFDDYILKPAEPDVLRAVIEGVSVVTKGFKARA
jgi:two-component system, sensor histidine kinase